MAYSGLKMGSTTALRRAYTVALPLHSPDVCSADARRYRVWGFKLTLLHYLGHLPGTCHGLLNNVRIVIYEVYGRR